MENDMSLKQLNKVTAYTKKNPYDFDNKIMLQYYPKRVLQLIGNAKELTLLELGLGHGYSAMEFKGKVKEYTILDGDSEIIRQFNDMYPSNGIQIIQTFFENYTSTKKFDVIIAGFVLEHVDDPLQILVKYSALLNKNGRLFITVPNGEALNRRIGHAAGILPDMQALSEHDLLMGHKRIFTQRSINELCKTANLKVVREEGLYLKPLTTRQLISLNLNRNILDAFCAVGRDYPELSLGILIECQV